jgi:hypothetical protein
VREDRLKVEVVYNLLVLFSKNIVYHYHHLFLLVVQNTEFYNINSTYCTKVTQYMSHPGTTNRPLLLSPPDLSADQEDGGCALSLTSNHVLHPV